MEDNADTEVVVEHKYILEVNVGTLDNINVISFSRMAEKKRFEHRVGRSC